MHKTCSEHKKYEKIIKAKFIERENRFVARVETGLDDDAETVKVHVKNTGRCRELLIPGSTGYLEDFEGRMGSRRMRYSLVAVEKKVVGGALLINMDSQAPNKVVREALEMAKSDEFTASKYPRTGLSFISFSCEKPAVSSSIAATLPRTVTSPPVGKLTPVIIFNMVDLPAPFRPMKPTDSPGYIVKDTPFSAGCCFTPRLFVNIALKRALSLE